MIGPVEVLPPEHFKRQWYCNALPVEVRSVAITSRQASEDSRSLLPISRLPRITCSEAPWLAAMRLAIDSIHVSGPVVIGSTGSIGWEYPVWYANRKRQPIVVVLMPGSVIGMHQEAKQTISQLALDSTRTTFLKPLVEGPARRTERFHLRDEFAFLLADRVFPISIRPGGYWDRVLEGDARVDQRFAVNPPQPVRSRVQGWSYRTHQEDLPFEAFLFHWTRGASGPFPGETRGNYYSVLTEGRNGNPRDGAATLCHILETGILRGEGRMFRGAVPALSFTSLAPDKWLKSRGYRNALGRWNFEPYAIGPPKVTLAALGARPVIYGEESLFATLSPEDRPYFQLRSSPQSLDWSGENEWRLPGDLDLASLADKLLIIVPETFDLNRLPDHLRSNRILFLGES